MVLELGEVEVKENISDKEYNSLRLAFIKYGLELMNDKKSMLIEKIKNTVVEMVHYTDEIPRTNFSDFISKKLKYEYHYLSHLFSQVNGITIEQYIILHKIERTKESLVYNELSMTEIAYKLHYSSVSHLSNQFKKVTGLTPSFFKKMKHKRLITLENL